LTAQESRKLKKAESPPQDNVLLAALSHLSILTVLLIGPFSMVIPLIIWLLERNKSNKSTQVEFHAKQAFFYQLAVYLIGAVLGIFIGLLSIILIGLLFIPVLILFGMAALIYGAYGGIRVGQGEDFRYIYVADFIEA